MKSPHLLLAAGNCHRLHQNLSAILDATALAALETEIHLNVAGLFNLGNEHLAFARGLAKTHWRQRVSRLYYAAYNVGRSVRLANDGQYHTDVTDHKRIDNFPPLFPNKAMYATQLAVLREDRNLCDYDHTVAATDLAIAPDDAEILVVAFAGDAKTFLSSKGIAV